MFENLKQSFALKKAAYEASAGFIACIVLAALFALGALVIWVADWVGPIFAALVFSGVFLVLAAAFRLVSGLKHSEAGEKLEAAEQQVSDTAHAVSATVSSAAAIPTKPNVWIPVLLIAGLMYVILEGRRPGFASAFPDDLRD